MNVRIVAASTLATTSATTSVSHASATCILRLTLPVVAPRSHIAVGRSQRSLLLSDGPAIVDDL